MGVYSFLMTWEELSADSDDVDLSLDSQVIHYNQISKISRQLGNLTELGIYYVLIPIGGLGFLLIRLRNNRKKGNNFKLTKH